MAAEWRGGGDATRGIGETGSLAAQLRTGRSCRIFGDMKAPVALLVAAFATIHFNESESRAVAKRPFSDQSVRGYLTERTCWWNEVCKEEFQLLFRCKCPVWSYCRSPGRYYNAFCSMTGTGYIWTQPDRSWGSLQVAVRGARSSRPPPPTPAKPDGVRPAASPASGPR